MTETTSFLREVDEDVRRERMERLWAKYGRAIVTVAVLAVLATAVLTYTQNRQNAKDEAATTQVAEVLQTLKGENATEVQSKLSELAPNLPEGQAAVTRLYIAGLATEGNDRTKALSQLSDLAADSRIQPLYRDLAKLLSIQLRLDNDDPDALKKELEPLMAAGQPWRYSAREDAALLALKTGDTATAHDLFEQLKGDADTPTSIKDRATKFAANLN